MFDIIFLKNISILVQKKSYYKKLSYFLWLLDITHTNYLAIVLQKMPKKLIIMQVCMGYMHLRYVLKGYYLKMENMNGIYSILFLQDGVMVNLLQLIQLIDDSFLVKKIRILIVNLKRLKDLITFISIKRINKLSLNNYQIVIHGKLISANYFNNNNKSKKFNYI